MSKSHRPRLTLTRARSRARLTLCKGKDPDTLKSPDLSPMILCVWNEHQKVPANLYGQAHHPDNFEIRVCANPVVTRDQLLVEGKRALVYRF